MENFSLCGQANKGIPIAHVDNVLALIAFLVIRTGAGRLMCDMHAVDVARCSYHVNGLFGNFFCAAPGAINDEHSAWIFSMRESTGKL